MAARPVPPQLRCVSLDAACRPARAPLRRAGWRAGVSACALAALLAVMPLPLESARAAPVKTQVSGTLADGFGRIVFTMAEEVEADVRLANGILVVAFKTPVAVNVDLLAGAMGGYVGAVRRDPDGGGVRLALLRKVRVNTMAAGTRLYVDLLPEGWTGTLPGLPQEVVDELARRARDAERKLRQQQQASPQRSAINGRVRVATLPTLTRYTFELSGPVPASSERIGDRLVVAFEAPVAFDLADARSAAPPTVSAIESETGEDSTAVTLSLVGKVDVTTFREDDAFVVDVGKLGASGLPRAGAETVAKPKSAAATAPPDSPQPPEAAKAPETAKATNARKPEAPPPALMPATAAAAAPPAAPDGTDAESPMAQPQDDAARLVFAFPAPTSAAVFRRADTLWLVFDTAAPIDMKQLREAGGDLLRDATLTRSGDAQVVRMKLARPRLVRASVEGGKWVITLGTVAAKPAQPAIARAKDRPLEAAAAFQKPARLHRLPDPDIGDTLLVVTGSGPVRGLGATQEFVEFRALPATHGVVLAPLADDLAVTLEAERVLVGRPGGLTLTASAGPVASERGLASFRAAAFDPQIWGFDQQADMQQRAAELVRAAVEAPDGKRTAARLALARFYMARGLHAEAKGVLDVAIASERDDDEVATAMVMRSVANLANGHPDAAIKELSAPAVGNQHDAELWRGVALSRLGRFADARQKLKAVDTAAAGLPVELQRIALMEAVRSAIETGNAADGLRLLNDFEVVGITPEMQPAIALMSGRLAEALGRAADALAAYESAAAAADQPVAAAARLRLAALRHALKQLGTDDTIVELERLTAAWRGDDTELSALEFLARLYTEQGRFREAFQAMRVALTSDPRSELSRRMQDEAAVTFEALFLGERGNAMSPIDALALYYDFRMLTPPGRRGDEMIRRLAERLVAIDLLPQAGELLQHQVEHRLQGAARAQVAVKLAMIYLSDHRPDRALQVLRTTRMAELPNAMRSQRLLLEARALSDTGRHDLALELVAEQRGQEAMRLRADILWGARRWRAAAEQIERLYDARWQDFKPLQALERNDVLRAAVGYALEPDPIGLDRLREKYAAKMSEGPDGRIFDVVSAPERARGAEFEAIAKTASSVDTMDAFLADLRAKYPDAAPASAAAAAPRG